MEQSESPVLKTFDLIIIALMVALLVISARISIPLGPVPITLQTLVVILNGLLVGPRRGWMAPLIYLIMGLVGFPFFATGGGIGYLFRPTFGFLIGFIPASLITAFVFQIKFIQNRHLKVVISGIIGIAIIYTFGFLYIPLASIVFGSKLAVWAMIIPTLPFMILGEVLKISFLTAIVPAIYQEFLHIRENLAGM